MSDDNKEPPVREMKFNPKDITCGFGKPMTYEEMMEDKKKKGGGGQVQSVDMNQLMKSMANMTEKDGITPEMKKQMSDMLKAKGKEKKDKPVFGPPRPPEKPKTVIGRDGTVYNLESMKARRAKK